MSGGGRLNQAAKVRILNARTRRCLNSRNRRLVDRSPNLCLTRITKWAGLGRASAEPGA
jgi:hypothetical protein